MPCCLGRHPSWPCSAPDMTISGISESNRPKMPVKITDCGMLPIRDDADADGAGDGSDSDGERLKKAEQQQSEVTEELVTRVTDSVQAALKNTKKRAAEDALPGGPGGKKRSAGKGMLSFVDAVEGSSDSE